MCAGVKKAHNKGFELAEESGDTGVDEGSPSWQSILSVKWEHSRDF